MNFSNMDFGRCRPADLGKVAFAAIALLLAGCSQGEAEIAAAPVEEMPKTVAGKWRITVRVDGKGGEFPMNTCSPETPIDGLLISGLPANGKNCKDRTFTKESERSWRLHAVCAFIPTGGRKADALVTIDTHVTGDLKTGYHVESRQVMSVPMNGVTQQVIAQAGERIGDC